MASLSIEGAQEVLALGDGTVVVACRSRGRDGCEHLAPGAVVFIDEDCRNTIAEYALRDMRNTFSIAALSATTVRVKLTDDIYHDVSVPWCGSLRCVWVTVCVGYPSDEVAIL